MKIIYFDKFKHGMYTWPPELYTWPANKCSWSSLVLHILNYTFMLSKRHINTSRFVYILDKCKQPIIDNSNVISDKKLGGIKLYYRKKYQVPVHILGFFIFYKTINTEQILFWSPLKLHWSNAGQKLSYEIGGKTSNMYVKLWYSLKQDFVDIYADQYNIAKTITAYITPSSNEMLYNNLSKLTKTFIINS